MSHPVEIGVDPGPLATRLLMRDGPTTLAKARLPHSPQHPRALLTLAEGVALWTGGRSALRLLWSARALSAPRHAGSTRSSW